MSHPITGTVKWFDVPKGYGFIAREDGEGDVFVHCSVIEAHNGYRVINEGDRVKMIVEQSEKGPQATRVTLVA